LDGERQHFAQDGREFESAAELAGNVEQKFESGGCPLRRA
jgi:hypothetical protein